MGATAYELHRTNQSYGSYHQNIFKHHYDASKKQNLIAEGQCGFVEGKGTKNAMELLRTIIE